MSASRKTQNFLEHSSSLYFEKLENYCYYFKKVDSSCLSQEQGCVDSFCWLKRQQKGHPDAQRAAVTMNYQRDGPLAGRAHSSQAVIRRTRRALGRIQTQGQHKDKFLTPHLFIFEISFDLRKHSSCNLTFELTPVADGTSPLDFASGAQRWEEN